MKLNQNFLSRILPEKKNMKMLVSTFLLTLGVYLSFPDREMIAVFPLMFLFAVGAYAIFDRLNFLWPVAGGIAFFYGLMASLPDPFLFAAVSAILSAAGGLCFAAYRKIAKGDRLWGSVLFFLAVAVGIAGPLVYQGTPAAHLSAVERAESYLEETYPDQRFSDMTLFYDLRRGGYLATVEYDDTGHTLTSQLFFGEDGVEDGFRRDFSLWMLDMRKAQLIEALREGAHSVVLDSVGFTEEGNSLKVYRGSFGQLRDEMLPMMHYRATFREEKTNRREFATAVEETLSYLLEKEIAFGQITFVGQDSNIPTYSCEITPDTDPEEILSKSQVLK